jgi:hypothetical protein
MRRGLSFEFFKILIIYFVISDQKLLFQSVLGGVNNPLQIDHTHLKNRGPNMRFTEGVNFINILCTRFWYKSAFILRQSQNVTREKLLKRLSYEKGAHKTLMKLTKGVIQIIRGTIVRAL